MFPLSALMHILVCANFHLQNRPQQRTCFSNDIRDANSFPPISLEERVLINRNKMFSTISSTVTLCQHENLRRSRIIFLAILFTSCSCRAHKCRIFSKIMTFMPSYFCMNGRQISCDKTNLSLILLDHLHKKRFVFQWMY